MSEENVEIARLIFERFAEGNFAETPVSLASDVVVSWEEPPTAVFCRGPAELATKSRAFFQQWGDFRAEVEAVEALDEDSVLVVTRQLGSGKRSGVEIDSRGHAVLTLRGGEVHAFHWYFDRAKALEAAGLSE